MSGRPVPSDMNFASVVRSWMSIVSGILDCRAWSLLMASSTVMSVDDGVQNLSLTLRFDRLTECALEGRHAVFVPHNV